MKLQAVCTECRAFFEGYTYPVDAKGETHTHINCPYCHTAIDLDEVPTYGQTDLFIENDGFIGC